MARDFAAVQQQIEQMRARWVADYAATWQRIIAGWRLDGAEDRVWLTYSANYLLRTGNTRWAIDPFVLSSRVAAAEPVEIARDLQGLSFVALTHQHADHLDLNLIRALRDEAITWVIPAFLQERVVGPCGLRPGQVITPRPLQPLEVDGVRLIPLNGLHWEKQAGGLHGVDSMAYVAECGGWRWLFAGDIRQYALEQLPDLGRLDGACAHLWLGRGRALEQEPPLLEPFCRFFADLELPRLVITHLHELGRGPQDYWDMRHYDLARARLGQWDAEMQVSSATIGESFRIGR